MSEFISAFMLQEHLAWNWMIVAYFFLGGLAAGAYLLSVAANYWLTDLKPIATIAALVAIVTLGVGSFFVWLDLGAPLRVFYLFLHFNAAAPASWGSWFLAIFLAIAALYALACLTGREEKVKRLAAIVGVPFALLTATYTGVLMNRAPGLTLWHNAMLPALFLNGGLISGIALTMVLTAGRLGSPTMVKLGRFVACLVAAELLMVFSEVAILSAGGTESAAAVRALLTGPLSATFWLVQVIAGSVVPLMILAFDKKGRPAAQVIACLLLLVGVYTMRHIVVIGGQLIG